VQQLIERLAIQVDSFQEGFHSLAKVNSLKDMAKQFMHILRGNLLLLEVSIYYKSSAENPWQELYTAKKGSDVYICHFNEDEIFRMNFLDDPRIKICVTQPMIDRSYFGILLGEKLDKTDFSDMDKILLQIFLQLLDSAYQSFNTRKKEKDLIFLLNHRVLQLTSLIDTGIEIAKLQNKSSLMHLALERVLALTNASKAMLRVKEGRKVTEKFYYPAPFKAKLLEHSTRSITTDFTVLERRYSFYLFEKESRRGLVPFDMTDQLLLDAFARQVHVSLENNYLYEQSLEMQRIDQEISVAGSIQKKLIPETLPKIDGYDIAGINIPTKYVGGDYYDCIPLKDGRYALIIADVSGKGIPAGLLVSTLQASLHAYLEGTFNLAALAQKLNKVIYDAATMDKYITGFIAILHAETGEIESVSAGHNPIYIVRKNKKIEELKTGGIPFGMLGLPFPYESSKNRLNPGDRLLLYTDGVTEAMNEKEEEYEDIISLSKFLKKNNPADAQDFIRELMDDINRFTGDTPQTDDITAVYLIRNK
jgi:sigma-B regulation protein RsbU (phosphoserine phosphatase)